MSRDDAFRKLVKSQRFVEIGQLLTEVGAEIHGLGDEDGAALVEWGSRFLREAALETVA